MKTLDELLTEFPADWDVEVAVCCRGETHNGPLGIRRWTATAIPKMPSFKEMDNGKLPGKERLQSQCSDTPREAVLSVIAAISTGSCPSD